MKKWYQSKTMGFSVVLAGAGAIQQFLPQVQSLLTAEAYGWTLLVAGVVSGVLRTVTTQALK
jgi:hypothetical protein